MTTKLKYLLASVLVIATIVACTVPQVVTNPDGSTTTNNVVDPKAVTVIETTRAVNVATAPLNPYSPLVEIALGTAALVLGWFAKKKNGEATSANAQLVSVIKGVNNADDAKVKEEILSQATTDGVETQLNKTVKSVESGLL
jgi:hypothetical protein